MIARRCQSEFCVQPGYPGTSCDRMPKTFEADAYRFVYSQEPLTKSKRIFPLELCAKTVRDLSWGFFFVSFCLLLSIFVVDGFGCGEGLLPGLCGRAEHVGLVDFWLLLIWCLADILIGYGARAEPLCAGGVQWAFIGPPRSFRLIRGFLQNAEAGVRIRFWNLCPPRRVK